MKEADIEEGGNSRIGDDDDRRDLKRAKIEEAKEADKKEDDDVKMDVYEDRRESVEMEMRDNNGDFDMDGEEQLLVSLAKNNDGHDRTEMDTSDNGDNVEDITMTNRPRFRGIDIDVVERFSARRSQRLRISDNVENEASAMDMEDDDDSSAICNRYISRLCTVARSSARVYMKRALVASLVKRTRSGR